MISLDIKQSSTIETSTPKLSAKDEKLTLSFASLLNAVGAKGTDKDTKSLQNGVIALALEDLEDTSTKTSTKEGKKVDIFSLLQNDKNISIKDDEEVLGLNPKITSSMSSDDLKALTHQAKKYLKEQVLNSDGFKKQEIDSLPKTVNGLIQVAKKVGIDISKITLEKVQEHPLNLSKKSLKTETQKQKTIKIADVKNELVRPETKVQQKTSNVLSDVNNAVQIQTNVKQKSLNAVKTSSLDKSTQDKNEFIKQELASKEVPKKLKESPLFSAQTKTEITTQEIVTTKAIMTKPKESKEKNQNSLELLLRGEKASHSTDKSTILTADFSVSTAKVIAPTARTETTKTLESLLHNSKSDSDETNVKSDGLNVAKADSFEVKLNEAKQLVKYLSQDVKSAIQEYKSPFTRVKVQLNPQKLGEIDLTIVQRGKNLHINLSSNNAAINTLAMNANDLKIQLNNNGINNASLNFNNSSQNSDSAFGSQTQQQQQQQRDEAQSGYDYFAKEESNEEILSSLEIVVPNYA